MSQNDKIAQKLKNHPNAKEEEGKIKIKTESFYIKYNPMNRHLTIGTYTSREHYAIIILTPSYVKIKTKIGEGDYFTVKIKKQINMLKVVTGLVEYLKTVDDVLREQGIEVDI